MVAPRPAPVRPRVLSALSGESLLLENEIDRLVAAQKRGRVRLIGPVGSGKTTALEHLAEVFAGADILFLDCPSESELALPPFRLLDDCHDIRCFRHVGRQLLPASALCEDEWIEYLLAVHKDRCRSVMARLRADVGRDLLQGNAQLCHLALDQMASDESIQNVRSALLDCSRKKLSTAEAQSVAQKQGLDLILSSSIEPDGIDV